MGFLGGISGVIELLLGGLDAQLGRSWAVLGDLRGVLGRSCALLGCSWVLVGGVGVPKGIL